MGINLLGKDALSVKERRVCSMEDTKDSGRRFDRKGRSGPAEQWWVSESFAKRFLASLVGHPLDDYMIEGEEWLEEENKEEKQHRKDIHEMCVGRRSGLPAQSHQADRAERRWTDS